MANEVSPRSGASVVFVSDGAISRPVASAFFVSDGPISSNSGRNGGKNAGRNYVSALPQRAIPGSDLLRILADIAFHHRCQSKGLRVRSPARRLPRPLAPATVGVFLSYRCTPISLPLEGSAVLNDTPVACQIRGPTRRETTVGSDFPHLLAGITFHHRCQSKGLRVRSPARRLTRPLAPATVGVFLSYRHPPKPSPRVAHPLKPSPWWVRGVE